MAAVGPVDAPARNSGIVMTGWDDRPEGRYGSVEVVIAADRYRITLTTPAGKTSQALDGDVAWSASNDRGQPLSGDDITRMRRIAMRYRPLKDRPANLRMVGVDSIGGREMYVTAVRLNPATTHTLYFDAVTGLLRRELTTTDTILVPLEDQVDYEDYRNVDGVQLPFVIRTTDGAPYDLVTKTFVQIRRNVSVDDALFRLPGLPAPRR